MAYDPKQTTWFNPNIEYLFDDDIIEYDIQDAGFSLIKEFKLLPDEKINELARLDKGLSRHIEVGKLQRDDKQFSQRLSNAFEEARRHFINTNKIADDSIVSVKKDAIFTTANARRTNFGHVHFATKHRYTSYLRFSNIHNIEIYYSNTNVDYKQINDHCINRHRLYTVSFLEGFIKRMESMDKHSVQSYLMNYLMKYKAMELDEEHYLEFNNKSTDINPSFNFVNVLVPLVQLVIKERC